MRKGGSDFFGVREGLLVYVALSRKYHLYMSSEVEVLEGGVSKGSVFGGQERVVRGAARAD
jgi:hypothetical protein